MRGVGRYHYVAQAYDGFAKCVMSCLQRSPGHRNVSSGSIDRASANEPNVWMNRSTVIRR